MNILKSVNVALAKKGMKKADLAAQLSMSPQSFSRMINKPRCTSVAIESLATAFDMKVSEFLALGEE